MPELPEAETVARTLLPHIKDCVFQNARLLRKSSLHPLSMPISSLKGLKVVEVRRRGKLIILDLENSGSSSSRIPKSLLFHLRMTGRVFTAGANREQGKHTRCIFSIAKPDLTPFQLFFDDTRAFGQIFAATPALLDQWRFWRELGPEPLEIDASCLEQRLRGSRAIKASLMDQSVIAGIGNIYADESLFQAGIHPERETCSLREPEVEALLAALQGVLRASISQCGSSIRDYRDANGNVGSFQNSFQVYGRGGEPCVKCGAPLKKTRLGGRATVFCENCQK